MRRAFYRRSYIGLNMTPMIDVIFQLLIFFVCTVEFQEHEDMLEARLPTSRPGVGAAGKTIAEQDLGRIDVDISRQAVTTRFQGRSQTLPNPHQAETLRQLTSRLQAWSRIDPRIPARIQCQPDVSTGVMLRVYDACLQAGLKDVGLANPS